MCAEALGQVAQEHPSVAIGSYPKTDDSQAYGVKISLTSRDQEALQAAAAAVKERIDIL